MPEVSRENTRVSIYLFAGFMLALFALFVFLYPPQSLTPQVARLRYYALQDDLEGGPLSSSLSAFDWRKAFIWRASDTEYRQRQLTQFFEMLTPRIYAHLYYRFGPFMWLPVTLLTTLIIGYLVALPVRQWTGSWLPGLAAGSYWLLTAESLVGYHAPIRYAKDFVTIQILGMLSLLLAARNPRRRWWCAGGFLALAGAGLFTDEYILVALPAFVVLLFVWPWLRRVRWPVAVALAVLVSLGLWLFFSVLPSAFSPDVKEPYLSVRVSSWPPFGELLLRNARYLVLNTLDTLTYSFGSPPPRSGPRMFLAALAGAVFIFNLVRTRAWKGTGYFLLFWIVLAGLAGGVLLPEGTDILHQPTYYNRPLVAVLMVVLGLFLANIIRRGSPRVLKCSLAALALAALLNYSAEVEGFIHDPEESYLTRQGLNGILQLHPRLRSGDITSPVFLSYPNYFDVTDGVYEELEYLPWHTLDDGTPPWSLYRSLVPRLYIRHFEKGGLRADPRQFSRWKDTDPRRYRAAARTFYDMPAGVVWDLEAIREAADPPTPGLTWKSDDGREVVAGVIGDLLGEAPAVSLPPGSWRSALPLPPGVEDPVMIFALRYRDAAEVYLPKAAVPHRIEGTYLWSFRLHAVRLRPGPDRAAILLESGGGAEVIGPLIISARAVAPVPPSARREIPPAGIPLLELRGRVE